MVYASICLAPSFEHVLAVDSAMGDSRAEGAAAEGAQGEFEDSLSLSLYIVEESAMTGEIMSSHCFLVLTDTSISLLFVFLCLFLCHNLNWLLLFPSSGVLEVAYCSSF